MYNEDSQGNLPFPIPISPNMPFEQQFSMNSLNPGMNTQPVPAMDYNFSAQYKHGGHISEEESPSLEHIINSIREKGHGDDEILAYINPEEADELDQRYGHDINPHTGLPQYGFFDFIKKYILPIGGAVLGNFIAPGIGGVLGGALGGGLGGLRGKKPLQSALKGAALGGLGGAVQGFGLPLAGRALSNVGMPQLGSALMQAGQSRFIPAFGSLGKASGISSLIPAAGLSGLGTARGAPALMNATRLSSPDYQNAIMSYLTGKQAAQSKPEAQSSGLLGGGLLNNILLALSVAGAAGSKTRYKIPGEYKNEPSFQQMIEGMKYKPSEKDKSRFLLAYKPSPDLFKIPDVTEHGYKYTKFSKGGIAKFPGGGRVPQQKNPLHTLHIVKPPPLQTLHIVKPPPLQTLHIVPKPVPKPMQTNVQKPPQPVQTPILTSAPIQKPAPMILSPEIQQELKPIKEFIANLSKSGIGGHQYPKNSPLMNIPLMNLMNSPLMTMGGLLGNDIRYIPEEEMEQKKSSKSNINRNPLPAYVPHPSLFNIPDVMEKGFQYTKFKKGGFIDGESGGQDDNRRKNLPQGAYIIDATTLSLTGDGNTKAGNKKWDEWLNKFSPSAKLYAKGNRVKKTPIPALVSDGEKEIPPHIVSAIGKGNNDMGAKILKKMIANIRHHKGVKGLPPKSKSLSSYLARK